MNSLFSVKIYTTLDHPEREIKTKASTKGALEDTWLGELHLIN